MSSTEVSLKTPLHDWHVANSGRMVDFAGWSMPIQYRSIIEEHSQTRNSVGMFDVSHMGRLYFSGPNVAEFLDRLTTRRVAGVDVGKIRYSLLTNTSGGILDDVLVYHLPDASGHPIHMMVVNASNRQKIVDWIEQHRPESIQLDDRTLDTAMIAIQGPRANAIVSEFSETDPASLAYYTGTSTEFNGKTVTLSRTGYTGEDGCELIVAAEDAEAIWVELFQRAREIDGGATGLGARDTLRLEAGMPLYGHELTEDINAAQTGLKFAINVKNREFVGREAILEARKNETLPIRVGLEVESRRAARDGCEVLLEGINVGTVTSGTIAPTLNKSISMAYVERTVAAEGTDLIVDIRGKQYPAKVVALPFYSRS